MATPTEVILFQEPAKRESPAVDGRAAMREPHAMRSKRPNRCMHRHSALATLGAGLAVLCLAASPPPRALGQDRAAATMRLAQADVSAPLRRTVPRIRVHPAAQTHPGSNSVRQCVAWLEPEYRPSGTVIVPRMHCWWEG